MDDRDEAHAEREAERMRALHKRVEELTKDIGSVLHANTSILFMAQQTMDIGIQALRPSPFAEDKAPTFEEVDEVLATPAQRVARAIEKFLEVASEPARAGAVSAAERDELIGFATLMSRYTELIPIEESRPATLRTVACRILDILAALPPKLMPREVVRGLRNAAGEVERLVSLASMLQTRSAILQMDYTIRSFREFVTTDLRRPESPHKLRVAMLLDAAHRQLTEYAHSSNVEIRTKNEAPDARVFGVERELVRGLANLLHNAVKYSWHRGKSRPWVSVRVRRADQNICVEFENWGVPISADELAEGTVFELGYRGEWSTDRGRLGTGIGLTDARDIATRHRGHIALESRPARSWGPGDPSDEEYYEQPFLTTVTIALPEAL